MPYVRDSMWRGREWRDEAHMQAEALRWCTEVAGRRHHRSLEGAMPLVVFEAVEAEALIALPAAAFELARWSTPKVGPDCHIKVGKALYSVPWHHIGRRVDAGESERTVEVFIDGKVIKTWARIERGRQTDWADYPPEKVAFFMRTPTPSRRTRHLGRRGDRLVAGAQRRPRLRAAQGVVRLADKYGAERLNAACARAVAVGDPSYRTVKGVLVAGTESEDSAEIDGSAAAPAHLHGPQGLFDTATEVPIGAPV